MAVTLSANVDDQMAQKVRSVAEKEHRSISNVVSSALTVFTGLPREVRDVLLELQADPQALKRMTREMMATIVRVRLEAATAQIASEGVFAEQSGDTSEIDLMEEATRLASDARRTQRRP